MYAIRSYYEEMEHKPARAFSNNSRARDSLSLSLAAPDSTRSEYRMTTNPVISEAKAKLDRAMISSRGTLMNRASHRDSGS